MKKLVKKIVAASVLAMVASTALAEVDSYLYWMVADNVVYWNGVDAQRTVKDVNPDYTYVKVKGAESGTYLTWYSDATGETDPSYTKMRVNEYGGTKAAYWGIDSSLQDVSLMFELYSLSDDLIAWWGWDVGVSLTELAPYITDSMASGSSGATPYVITGVVPEPTSGLLSLFGLAVLALRRKKLKF